jgi:hypothetical protein
MPAEMAADILLVVGGLAPLAFRSVALVVGH